MDNELAVVREIVRWLCANCGEWNEVGIPTSPEHVYACHKCKQVSGLAGLARTSWQLKRSTNCPDCKGSGVIFNGYVRVCGLCQWSQLELDYKPGTMVTYIPPEAQGDPNHRSSEHGIVVKNGDFVAFVCYQLPSGAINHTSQMTNKSRLYLDRWTSGDVVDHFISNRQKA